MFSIFIGLDYLIPCNTYYILQNQPLKNPEFQGHLQGNKDYTNCYHMLRLYLNRFLALIKVADRPALSL